MQLSSYEVVLNGENGYVHVNVICDDGSKFGQWIKGGSPAEMDLQVNNAIARVSAQQDADAQIPEIGMSRSAADVAESLASTDVNSQVLATPKA